MAQTSSQGTVNKIEMRLREKGRGSSLPTRLCRLRNAIIREVVSVEINLTKNLLTRLYALIKARLRRKMQPRFI